MTSTELIRPTYAVAKISEEKAEGLRRIGCLLCRRQGVRGCGTLEFHHPTSGGRRLGDDLVIPLGRWHHQGIPPTLYMTKTQAREKYGPSLADGRKPFEKEYGTEVELLEETERLLNGYQEETKETGES